MFDFTLNYDGKMCVWGIYMKKSRKKILSLWTKRGLSRIFCALLPILALCVSVADAEESVEFVTPKDDEVQRDSSLVIGEAMMLREEVKFLQQELIEIIGKYEALKERDMQLNKDLVKKLAGLEKGTEGDLSAPESALKIVSEVSMNQATQTIRFCESLSQTIKGLTMSELERYKLESELKSLRRGAEKTLSCLNGSEDAVEVNRCDVLSVDDKLRVVVLAVGSKDGVKIGDTWRVGEEITLRIVSVRSYVSAGMLTEGKISDIAPGMKAMGKAIKRTKK